MSTGDASGGEREMSSRKLSALSRYAAWLDRYGLDPLLGLIPGAGDAAGAVLAGWILVEAIRLGASRATLLRITANVALDAVLGAVPVIGDVFDFAWKANLRNVTLLERHLMEPARAQSADRFFIACVIGGVIAVLVGAFTLGTLLTLWLLRRVVAA